jgi:hypothetical protein
VTGVQTCALPIFTVFTDDTLLVHHKIRCDKYYDLDKTDQKIHDYCYEQSKNGKVIIVNKELTIDINYVKQNKYKCFYGVDTEEFVKGVLDMNPKLKRIYENKMILILSDCVQEKEIQELMKNIEK